MLTVDVYRIIFNFLIQMAKKKIIDLVVKHFSSAGVVCVCVLCRISRYDVAYSIYDIVLVFPLKVISVWYATVSGVFKPEYFFRGTCLR